jgi:putative PIN family toxin of toxin-antitoxin system
VIRAVVDPGVFVSAFVSPRRAAPSLIVEAVLDGQMEALLCPTLIAELAGVLTREKFAAYASEGRAEAFVMLLLDRGTVVADVEPTAAETADPDDDYLVALARAHAVDCVVSGDRHLLEVSSDALRMLTPRELADRLEAESSTTER